MSLRSFLILMTLIAVISDSMLHPFYPQYFSTVLGVGDARYVGAYIASCSAVVMLSFPLWAIAAKKVHVLHLLIWTQLATCVLSVACCTITSLWLFWLVSLSMMVFKASYLLIYPYALSLDDKDTHIGTISLLAFVAYFGNIFAALLSGMVFEWIEPRSLFLVMAGGDVLQILLCLYLVRRPDTVLEPAVADPSDTPAPTHFVYRLGVVMLVLYFSAYLTDPFFSSYWENLTGFDDKVLSGLVFSIPGVAALLGLYVNATRRSDDDPRVGILPSILLGICGLLLEMSGVQLVVLAGRFVYGWALFQSMVRLDLLLFRLSSPETYAVDFSKINLFQGFGVLFASFAAGSLVASFDPRVPFVVAAIGFVTGAVLYVTLLRKELRMDPVIEPGPAVTEGTAT